MGSILLGTMDRALVLYLFVCVVCVALLSFIFSKRKTKQPKTQTKDKLT